MAESHVISALTSKRSELLGKITHYKQQIKKINNYLAHINSAIKIFNPDFNLNNTTTKQYREKNQYFKRGERATLVLDVLREYEKPLDTESIAGIVAKHKGIEENITKTIRSSLLIHLKNGIVKRKKGKNSYLWSLTA